MIRYIITIGGTGAKCYEAMVHLSAMGIFTGDVHILHIDPDRANGNWTEAFKTLDLFNNIKSFLSNRHNNIFKANFNREEGCDFFHPVPIKDPNVPNYYNSLAEYCPNERLLNLLYNNNVIQERWDIGFKGRPSLGAAVVAGAFDWTRNPWHAIRERIRQNLNNQQRVMVFLIGSIFGGTGASIFPSIAHFISQEFRGNNNFFLGGTLLFPYFSYIIPENERREYANPQNFLPKSKLHLEYFESLGELNPFKRIYILGENYTKDIKPATGGGDQTNPPHHLEPLTVLTAIDFFNERNFDREGQNRYKYLARENDNAIRWQDLPQNNEIKNKWLVFTTMACSYIGFWYHLLIDEDFRGSAWFSRYLSGDGGLRNKVDTLKEYFENYLKWLLAIHLKCTDRQNLHDSNIDDRVRLFMASTIRSFLADPVSEQTGETLGVLKWRPVNNRETGYYTPQIRTPYDFLWRKSCNAAENVLSRRELSPFERLVHILYDTCQEFVRTNYSY